MVRPQISIRVYDRSDYPRSMIHLKLMCIIKNIRRQARQHMNKCRMWQRFFQVKDLRTDSQILTTRITSLDGSSSSPLFLRCRKNLSSDNMRLSSADVTNLTRHSGQESCGEFSPPRTQRYGAQYIEQIRTGDNFLPRNHRKTVRPYHQKNWQLPVESLMTLSRACKRRKTNCNCMAVGLLFQPRDPRIEWKSNSRWSWLHL